MKNIIVALALLSSACSPSALRIPSLTPKPSSTGPLIVSSANMQGWAPVMIQTATSGFVSTPFFPITGTLGKGSYQFNTGSGDGTTGGVRQGGKPLLGNALYNNTLLSDLTQLSYYTYVPSGSGTVQAPYVNLYIDLNGSTGTILVYEVPTTNLTHDVWQNWNVLSPNSFWCTTAAVFGSKTCSTSSGLPNVSLADVIAAYPTAKIADITGLPPSASYPFSVGNAGLQFLAGSSTGGTWKNFVGYLDYITIGVGTTVQVYDFEN